MRTIMLLSAILLGVSAAVVLTRHPTHAQAPPDAVIPMTYRIPELPVWSSDGKFDPSILMALLETVDPPAWNGDSGMKAYPDKHCLVVATTAANHQKIGAIIRRIREKPQANY